jgi:ketosteroid isomerase-like protein
MTTGEVAKKLVELCRKGQFQEAMQQLYGKDIVSVEAMDMPNMPRTVRGIDAVAKKGEWWVANHTVHKADVEGPFVSVEKFAVVFAMDVTFKPTGKRSQMREAAVYTVAGGKIVHEEFLYAG